MVITAFDIHEADAEHLFVVWGSLLLDCCNT